jgi:hypothetical protein
MRLAGVKAVKKKDNNKLGGLKPLSVVRKHIRDPMLLFCFAAHVYDGFSATLIPGIRRVLSQLLRSSLRTVV